jgi:hypothetical protein
MKTFLIAGICSAALSAALLAQGPSPVTAPSTPAVTATTSPAASPESELERSIRKHQKKHINFTFGDDDATDGDSDTKSHHGAEDIPKMVLPIVAVSMAAIFGAPVLIVAVILYFGFSKSRMQHRTIRMMVEKGQQVPAELLAPPPPAVRQRSDMRRGVVWTMIGIGLTIFFGAVNDWEGGAWSLGLIPLCIGAGYLLVWKLEGPKPKGDKPPPLP